MIQFTSDQIPEGYFLSRSFPDLLFAPFYGEEVAHSYCRVQLGVSLGEEVSSDERVVYDEGFFTSGGEVCIREVWRLLVGCFGAGTCLTVRVRIDASSYDSSHTVSLGHSDSGEWVSRVYRCGVYLGDWDVASFHQDHFLTLLHGEKVTCLGIDESLYYRGDEPSGTVVAYYGDGGQERFVVAGHGVSSSDVSLKVLSVSAQSFVGGGGSVPVRYEVRCGGRYQAYAVVGDPADLRYRRFLFRNTFGVYETLFFTGRRTSKTSFVRHSFVGCGQLRGYGLEESRSWECGSGVVGYGHGDWLLDFLRSEEIILLRDGSENGGGVVVLIQSEKAEWNDDDDTLLRVQFTYRSSVKDYVTLPEGYASGGGVFDDSFDDSFD